MKMFGLVLLACMAMASISHADQCEHGICAGHENGNWDHDHGPGPGDHGPGWGHGPGYPPPPPPPHYHPAPPPYYPPPPPAYGPEYIECDSDGYRQNTCGFNGFRVSNVMLYQQRSNSPCILGQSYGIMQGQVWVANGCRALFRIDHY